MCLYMSVPRWISLERFAGAVCDGASHLIEVSLVLFLLNCHSDKKVAAATAAVTRGKGVDAAVAATATGSVVGDSTSAVALCVDNIVPKLKTTKTPPTVVVAQPKVLCDL